MKHDLTDKPGLPFSNYNLNTKPNSEESARGEKGGVRAFYYDIRGGEKKTVSVGNPPYHDLRYSHQNEAEAQAAIASYQNKSLRGKASFDFEMTGDPFVMSEAKLVQQPAFRPYIPAEWRIKSVSHRLKPNDGYTTSGKCELFKDNQQNNAMNIESLGPSTNNSVNKKAPRKTTKVGAENVNRK